MKQKPDALKTIMRISLMMILSLVIFSSASFAQSDRQMEEKKVVTISFKDYVIQNETTPMVKYFNSFPEDEMARQAIMNEVQIMNAEANPDLTPDALNLMKAQSKANLVYYDEFNKMIQVGQSVEEARKRAEIMKNKQQKNVQN